MIKLGLILGLLLGRVGVAAADADGPDYHRVTGVAVGDQLNIRSAPSPKARAVGVIPPGASCVRNLGCRGGVSLTEYSSLTPAELKKRLKRNPRWCKIEYQGMTGWVAGRYLEEGAC